MLSPADGAVSQIGPIAGGRIVQAKERDYSVAELLGRRQRDRGALRRRPVRDHLPVARRTTTACTCRPTAPCAARATFPGDLFSVNAVTADGVERLFARNERLACLFDTSLGMMASVMVGAMIVAGVETVWGGRVDAARAGGRAMHEFADGPQLCGRRRDGPVLPRLDRGPVVRARQHRMAARPRPGLRGADGPGDRTTPSRCRRCAAGSAKAACGHRADRRHRRPRVSARIVSAHRSRCPARSRLVAR